MTITGETYTAHTALNGKRDMASHAHTWARDFQAQIAPTLRDTLASAITRHGGPQSVVQQMGLKLGTKEYRSTLRTVERHQTAAGQQRGSQRLSEKYQQMYQKVLGKDTVNQITGNVTGPGRLPNRGTITITVDGTIKVSEDIRERSVWAEVDPADFEGLFSAPLRTWADMAGFGPEAVSIDAISFSYDDGEDV